MGASLVFCCLIINPSWEPLIPRQTPANWPITFRRLKKIADLEKDQPLVSDWHYWEKEMQRLGRKQNRADFRPKLKTWWANLGKFILLQAYKSACGYGENPARAAIVLSLLILLPFVGLAILNAPAHPDFYIPLLASKSPEGLGLGFKVIHKAYQLVVTLQAGFFALAMRNPLPALTC